MKVVDSKHLRNVFLILLTLSVLLFVVACNTDNTQMAEQDAGAEVTANPDVEGDPHAEETVEEEPELRTAEVFDLAAHKDKLSIRYFHMEGTEKTGDSILVTTPDGKNMLIDSGVQAGGQQVVKYLNDMGIDRLDVILNTHPHIDHLGGFPAIIRAKEIGEAYMINHPYPSSNSYHNFMSAMKSKKINPVYLEEGDSFELGEHVKIEVYRPVKGDLPDAVESYEARAINQFSMVFKLTYEETSFLFTGDIYIERENEMLENLPHEWLKADMMHAPHHGSETSSSSSFVEAVSAEVVVMSSNEFTSLSNMKRYEVYGGTVYSQSLHGNILITSDGKKLEVITEKDWENPLKK